ncbi:MAG: FAD-dependent oxidoreductase [Myxococcota bacterium]
MTLPRAGHAIVVGAGLAGLAAAQRLTSSGCAVSVLEARERVGGKHVRQSLAGIDYEPWPGVLPRSAPAYVELTAELGLSAALERTPLTRAAILRDGRLRVRSLETRAALRGSPLGPFRMRRLALLATWLGGALDPGAPARDTRLDDRSAADFCRVYLGRRALDELVAPLLASRFGLDARDASRQLLFSLLDPAGNAGLDSLSGAAALAEGLASRQSGLETAVRVDALEPDGLGVRLADGSARRADAVLLAVSSQEAARLLAALDPRCDVAFGGLRAESALVLAAATRSDVGLGERDVWIPEREGGELAGICARRPRLLQLVARSDLAARHGQRPDAELAHFLLESAARALPGLAGEIAETRLHRFPLGRPAFGVGHYRALARLGAVCAGDWCVAPHVEGELASGLAAARALAARLRAGA